MIETGLIFVFGFFTALLLCLLVAPIVWRRAKRLSRQEFDATIPATANEIRASFDHVRAAAAVTSRQREMQAQTLREKAAAEMAEAGRVARESALILERNRELEEAAVRSAVELEEARRVAEEQADSVGEIDGELLDTRHSLELRMEEMDALVERYQELSVLADERQRQIARLEKDLTELSQEVEELGRRDAGREKATEQLRKEKAELEAVLRKENGLAALLEERQRTQGSKLPERDEAWDKGLELPKDDRRPFTLTGNDSLSAFAGPSRNSEKNSVAAQVRSSFVPSKRLTDPDLEGSELREEIAELAAQVADLTARAEGPGSPIDDILSKTASDGSGNTASMTLIERIRRRRQAPSATADYAAE